MRHIIFRNEVNGQFPGCELINRTHNCREELLLECKPGHSVLDTLACTASSTYFRRLLVTAEIVINFGILNLIFVALLHSRDSHIPVEVIVRNISRYYTFHTYERYLITYDERAVLQ